MWCAIQSITIQSHHHDFPMQPWASFLQLRIYCLSSSYNFFSFVCLHYFPFPSHLKFIDVNAVFTWSISLIDFAPSTPILLSVIQTSLHHFLFTFPSSSLHRSSVVNVMFFWSISLNAFAPSSRTSLPIFNRQSFLSFSFLSFIFSHIPDSASSMLRYLEAFHLLILLLQFQCYYLPFRLHSFHFSMLFSIFPYC